MARGPGSFLSIALAVPLAIGSCASGPKPDTPDAGAAGGRGGGTGGAQAAEPPMFGAPAGRVDTEPVECAAPAEAGAFSFEKVAEWRDDATAAYAITHDDMCGPELRGIDRIALPALEMRSLTATLGPFVQICDEYQLWDMVRSVQARGHEIANHSFTHVSVRMQNLAKEVTMAKGIFDMHLLKPVTFYAFPYDDFSLPVIELVRAAGHIGARAGDRDDNDGFDNPPINPREPSNDMTLEFDAWPRAYSKYALYAEKDILNLHVHNAIERQGFAVREFHSVTTTESGSAAAGEGFGPVPLRLYEAHLDFLYKAWKANKVWTSTASTIIRYRHARRACKAAVSDTSIVIDASAPECSQHATPISVVVTTANDVPGLRATQGGKPVFVRKLGTKRFAVTADPTAGNVDLGGCSTPVSAVDATLALDPKPAPAASVCDLETVKGTGMPGNMDSLERPPGALQLLPNPGQADGRTGSWSWYPQTASIGIVMDGPTNRALRFAGSKLGWSGAALAFLGGNGAGTCYDASAYRGVRFRIRGSVTSSMPAFNGAVMLSFVTAETQRQAFGGDFKDIAGQAQPGTGHFVKRVPVTAEWSSYEIPWSAVEKPAWGPSTSFPRLAVEKLQVLDWGVDPSADFEIHLDDVELF